MIPSPESLLETIESFMQFAKIVGLIGIHKAVWLSHVNVFLNGSMQERIVDIHVRQGLAFGESNTENKLDGLGLNYRTECF